MKKFYLPLLGLLSLTFFSSDLMAQCGNRYSTEVFNTVSVTSDIQYGSNIAWTGGSTEDLFLDVYTPDGDTETSRPLIILVHGGSFVGGNKANPDVTTLANDFAKMGYVTSCIAYRLGMNTLPPDSASATKAVIRSYHDGKAAVRFFRKDVAENGNTYGIDPNKIFIIGVSAGGFTAVHMAYLDEVAEMPSYIDYTEPGLEGGLEGLSGNAGYSSDVTAVVNLCGALRDTAWMKPGDKPILSMHHPDDDVVPYGKDVVAPFFNLPILVVNGSDPIHDKAEELGLNHCFHTYRNVGAGNEHVPHVSEPLQYDTTLVFSRNFLYQFVCGGFSVCGYTNALGTDDILADNLTIGLYPNPATGQVNIDLTPFEGQAITLRMTDQLGRVVYSERIRAVGTEALDVSAFARGLYVVSVETQDNLYPTKLMLD